MNKLEYDSFYKFMVSMGIILFVTPMIAFYYLISCPYDLHIATSELYELSPLSQQIIELRQYILYNAIRFAPITCIVSSIIGIISVLYGAVKWHAIQMKIDNKYDLENEQLKLNISKMSEEDITKKVEAEIEEIEEIEEMEPESYHQNLKAMSKSQPSQRLLKYLQIEEGVSKNIIKRYNKTHSVDKHVRLYGAEYDIIARAQKWGAQDLIFEIKYYGIHFSVDTIKQHISQLMVLKRKYIEYTNRIPEAVLLVVIKDSVYEKCKQQVDQYLDSTEVENITVWRESEISN